MNEHEIYDYDDMLVITNTRRKQLEEEALAHHGILGMKWGIRRYQNEDGSLTELGQRHYDMLERKQELEYDRRNRKEEADVERERLRYQRETDKQNLSNQKKADKDKYWLQRDQRVDDFVNNERERKHARKQFVTALAVGAVAVGGGIALHHYLKKKGQETINSPKLTDAITAGSEKVEDIMKGAPLTFGSKSNKGSFTNKYDLGGKGTFADMKIDAVKKHYKLAQNGKWEADNDTISDLSNIMTKRRRAQLNANTAADMLNKQRTFERRKYLAGQVFEPGVRADKKGTVNWDKLAFNSGMKIPKGDEIFEYADKVLGTSSSKSSPITGASLADKAAQIAAKKADFDRSSSRVIDAADKLNNLSKKFKHSESGDMMDENTIMHTAMAIHRRRNEQLEHKDEYLMHYGRKGMKWGEDIYAQDPANNRQITGQSQYAQQLQAEAAKRKYGGTEQHYDTGRGAQIREQQRKQREAQAKYGGGSYYDMQKAKNEKNTQIREEQRKRREATINVGGKQVSTSDVEKYKNTPPAQAVEAQKRDLEDAKRKQAAVLAKEYPKTAATVAAIDPAITKAFESDNSDRIQRDLEKTANINDTDSVFDAVENSDEYDKLFRDHSNDNKKSSSGNDDINGRDIAIGLITKQSPRTVHNVSKVVDTVVDAGGKAYETKYKDRELDEKNDTAKDAYIKSQAKKRMHDDIDAKYKNGELDQTYNVGGQKVKIHPSEEDITRLKNNADAKVDKDYDDYKWMKNWKQRTNHS